MRISIFTALAVLLSLVSANPQLNGSGQGSGSGFGQSSAMGQSTASVATSTRTTATAAASVSEAAAATGITACNNSPDLCNRNYSNITHMGAHDAAFLRDSSTSFSVAGNQFYNATIALSAGIRMIQAQVHNLNGTLELCHTTCTLLDGGSLETFLSEIKTWMDANTNEVVTLLLVNSNGEEASTFGSVFISSGIDTYGYTPTTTTGPPATWPTLQTMITANTRLVTFIASITYDSTYPYLLSEFDFVFETAYGQSSFSAFNCTLDRPSTLSSASAAISSGYLSLINHFADTAEALGITIPAVSEISTTNSASTNTTGALGTEGQECAIEYGKKPVFMLVDFWNVGPSIETADLLNGITATGRTTVSTALLSASNSAGVRSETRRSWFGVAAMAMGVVAVGNFVWL